MDKFTTNGAARISPNSGIANGGHGRAALLLVESLMHGLLEKGVISREDFVEIVEGAAEVEDELNTLGSSAPSDPRGSLLYPLVAAFRKELGR